MGDMRAINTMPAFTMVAECKYALTGVGAAIAPGNQKWKGNCADFVKAPSKTRTDAVVITAPVGDFSANSTNDVVPTLT